MKNQALFPLKDKSKKLKCRLLQFLLGSLRVKYNRFESLGPSKAICFLKFRYERLKSKL